MNDRSSPPERIAGPGASGRFDAYAGRRVADRYDLVRVVFDGANTTVFDAVDHQTGRTVHVKLVAPERSASPSFRSRFDDTMRAVAAFSHPNIAALYDWGVAPVDDVSVAYVVVEQLTGGSLRDLFDRGRRLSPSQALVVGLDACKGLDYAHRRGFVHTELTPSKLVFGDDRRLRVIDFGLARLLGEPQWHQPDSVPNHVAWYSAPEQGAGRPVDGRTDVYALCLTLHEAVTGELPFKHGSTVAALAARVDRLMPVSADLGPLAAVIERAGRPERDERSTAAEFGQGLMKAAGKLPRPQPIPLLSTGLFDTPVEHLRAPDDPTGGVSRPVGRSATGTSEIVVVPAGDEPTPAVDEPDGEHGPGTGAAVAGAAAAAAAAASAADDALGQPAVDPPAPAEPAEPDDARPEPDDARPEPDDARPGDARPEPDEAPADEHPDAPVIVEAEPDLDLSAQRVADGDDLVILPLDSDIERTTTADPPSTPTERRATPPDAGEPSATGGVGEAATATATLAAPPVTPASETATMPVAPEPVEAARPWGTWIWKVLAGIVLTGAAIVGTIAAVELFATPTYEVPDLVGEPLADARAEIADFGWVLAVENERSDLVPEPGNVVRTSPDAGVDLAEGEPFLIVVSEGPTLREVPESAGELVSTAQTRLIERGLDVAFDEQFHEEVPEGTVVSWVVLDDPDAVAGALVEPGTEILLSVSQGPAPRTVPDLAGRGFRNAEAELGTMRLTLSRVGEEFSDDVPAGAIISQTPEAGETVERDTDVAVIVSKGPDVVPFPDITGADDFAAAAEILRAAEFDPQLVLGDTEGEVQSARIDGVDAETGTLFRRGSVVEIIAVDDA